MKRNLIVLIMTIMILGLTVQAHAALSYTMNNFQSLGPEYASGEISGTLSGDMNMNPMYSFCVNASADLYEGQPYSGTLTSIAGNTGLMEAAYLMNTYVPKNSALTDVNQGVALQWAIWQLIGQGNYITANGLNNTYSSVYTQSGQYVLDAQSASNLAQYAGEYETLSLAGSQSLMFVPTPIPAAAYLFGSGFLGLVGIRRKIQN